MAFALFKCGFLVFVCLLVPAQARSFAARNARDVTTELAPTTVSDGTTDLFPTTTQDATTTEGEIEEFTLPALKYDADGFIVASDGDGEDAWAELESNSIEDGGKGFQTSVNAKETEKETPKSSQSSGGFNLVNSIISGFLTGASGRPRRRIRSIPVVQLPPLADDNSNTFRPTLNHLQEYGLNVINTAFQNYNLTALVNELMDHIEIKNPKKVKHHTGLVNYKDNEIELDQDFKISFKVPPIKTKDMQINDASVEDSSEKEDSSENGDGSKKDTGDEKDAEMEDSAEVNDSEAAGDELSDEDEDEPPGGGDGMGGGILGLLAGLSGEDGQSDLGSLLAAVGGIVGSLSGEGFDLNSLIASGVGLLAGTLSDGMKNPGAIISSYLLTSVDSITGGGAMNNGKFFGKFLSTLIKGSSAAGDGDSEEGGGGSDVIGFILSLLGGIIGGSSGHNGAPPSE